MPQIEPIRYLTCAAQGTAEVPQQNGWKECLDCLTRAAEREQAQQAGFLLLESRETGERCYYHHTLDAVVGDLARPSVLEYDSQSYAEEMLDLLDGGSALRVACLPAGVLAESELAVFTAPAYHDAASRLGWVDLTRYPLMTVRPLTLRGTGSEVCWLPISRCTAQWKLPAHQSLEQRLVQMLVRGLVPVNALETCPPSVTQWLQEDVCSEILAGWNAGAGDGPDAEIHPASREETERLRQYFQDKPYRTANLPPYDASIFQPSKGSWDLYSFVGLTEEQLRAQSGPWYRVDGLFARDPRGDVASDANLVAIDFGTRSTTVAIFDGQGGNITVIPMGRFSERQDAFENPTILKFCDIRKFMEAYRGKEFQPDTEFNDLVVSQQALQDYESADDTQNGKNMLQYLQHLKQWAGRPNRGLLIQDQHGELVRLGAHTLEEEADGLNPIELYAYYIGLYINNMHQGRIYLKYLLSYSATYLPASREAIRTSFERGLKKSLPEAVGRDAGLMGRFEVRLWLDEATAYAVCALSRYLNQEPREPEQENPLRQELQDGELFYGTYDFGGGTLDFSMGTVRAGERLEIHKLGDGGGAHLGCENILEEMAFHIFSDSRNRDWLLRNKIRCNKPLFYGMRQGEEHIAGNSNAARYNTCNLVCALRQYWKGELGTPDLAGMQTPCPIYLEGENRTLCTALLGDASYAGSTPVLQVQPEEIEAFFRKKVLEGVRLFVDFYRDILRREERLRHRKLFVFLAGNASRAPRVKECFDAYLQEVGLSEQFCLLAPLPTEADRTASRKEPGRSIPTAKSGVVFGLLLARPSTETISVVDDTPRPSMRYCIGQKKLNWQAFGGEFQLLARPDQLLQAPMPYRRLRRINQSVFELLYTDDRRYMLEQERQPITDSVRILTVQVSDADVGLWLYGRVSAGDPEVLELGVSKVDGEFQSRVERVIGFCRFSEAQFQPAEEPGQAPDRDDPQEPIAPTDPEITVTDSQGRFLGRFRRAVLREQELDLGSTSGESVTFAPEWGTAFTVPLPAPGQTRALSLRWFAEGPYEVLICGDTTVYRLDFDCGTWEELS